MNIGIPALINKNGFAPDGSYIYGNLYSEPDNADSKFADTFTRINQGNRRFNYARKGEEEALEIFFKQIMRLKKANKEIVIFFPPFAPEVSKRMLNKGAQYAYIQHVLHWLSKKGLIVQDFSSAASLGSGSCEFVDGFHGGVVTYARLTRKLLSIGQLPHKMVNKKALDNIIKEYAGHAYAPYPGLPPLQEKDFLDIGCNK